MSAYIYLEDKQINFLLNKEYVYTVRASSAKKNTIAKVFSKETKKPVAIVELTKIGDIGLLKNPQKFYVKNNGSKTFVENYYKETGFDLDEWLNYVGNLYRRYYRSVILVKLSLIRKIH